MNFAERALYHQIHPAKLFADIATAFVAIEHYRASPMWAYLRQFMPPWVQAPRFFGVGVAFYAAWYHFPAGVISGLALVAICWANGIGRKGT